MIWSHQHIVFTAMLKLTKCLDLQHNNNNNHFTALCPGLPGWAGTRRNTHPPTILIIIQSLPASSIYHDPQHPHCSNYVLGNLFAQPLSKSSLVYLLVWSTPPHFPYISSPNQCLFCSTCPYHCNLFCCSMLGLIKRTFSTKHQSILLRLYKSLVRPHLEYCSLAWSQKYVMDKELLEGCSIDLHDF